MYHISKNLCAMKILNVIAQGSFGKVYRAQDPKTGHIFAVKQFFDNPTYDCEQLRREYAILKACQHPHILKCHSLVKDTGTGSYCYLVLDYFPMDLYTFIGEQETLSVSVLEAVTRQILQAVEYLHVQKRIIHTDIKPANFLVAGGGNSAPSVTLCDFSSSCVYGSSQHKSARGDLHGTLWYRAPENFLGSDSRTGLVFGFPMDMWAVGCVLYELVTGRPLFGARTDHEQFLELCTLFGTPTVWNWEDVKYRRKYAQLLKMPTYVNRAPAIIKRTLASSGAPREFIDLVLRLLVLDPVRRLTAKEALEEHPFMVGAAKKNQLM